MGTSHVHELEDLALLRYQFYPKQSTYSVHYQNPYDTFCWNAKKKKIQKCIWNIEGPRIAKAILKKKRRVVGLA